MPVYRNERRNSWYVSFYYIDWQGERRKKKKEGFINKKEAMDYERIFLLQMAGQCDMMFESFVELYLRDCQKRLKFTTYNIKKLIIKKYLLPYFCNMAVNKITPIKVRTWQTEILKKRTKHSTQYLHYINTQLACILNFAGKYYNLERNPMKNCETMGNAKSKKMEFWTLHEFNCFLKAVKFKEPFYTAFQILFWTGIRRGELLALRPADFNFSQKKLAIQRNLVFNNKQRCISTPKTENSNRVIAVPDFLLCIVKDYIDRMLIGRNDCLFKNHPIYFARYIVKYSELANLNPIRIHDFRHSHASLLIEEGISPLLIAERLGHKNVNTTLKIYAHLYPNKQQKLAEKLDKLHSQFFE